MLGATMRRLLQHQNQPRKLPFSIPAPKQQTVMSLSTANTTAASGGIKSAEQFPVEASIIQKLEEGLEPTVLRVMNESHMHNVPKNSETHFKVVIVSEKFTEGKFKSLVQRHRLVNSILKDEIATEGPVHALSIVAKTPEQWQKMAEQSHGEENIVIGSSPNCRGGDGSLPKRGSS